MSHLRKDPDGFYNCPEHVHGARGVWKRLLWRLGFDPLTVRQRLVQVRHEADDWKRWGDEGADAAYTAWGEDRSRIEWADAIRAEIERARARAAELRAVDCLPSRPAPRGGISWPRRESFVPPLTRRASWQRTRRLRRGWFRHGR